MSSQQDCAVSYANEGAGRVRDIPCSLKGERRILGVRMSDTVKACLQESPHNLTLIV